MDKADRLAAERRHRYKANERLVAIIAWQRRHIRTLQLALGRLLREKVRR